MRNTLKKNKEKLKLTTFAFTLIELLAVITILGIVALITYPIIDKAIKKSKEKSLEQTITNIERTAYSYSVEYDLGYSTEQKALPLSELINKGFLTNKEYINPVTNKELQGCVLYRWDENNKQYEFKYAEDCSGIEGGTGGSEDEEPTITLAYNKDLINSNGLSKENIPVTLIGNGTVSYCISDSECEPNIAITQNNYTKFITNEGINYICALTTNSIGSSEKACESFNLDKTAPVVSNVEKTSDEETSITIQVTASDTNGIQNYYYSINDNQYVIKEENTHTFTGLSKGTDYTIKVYVIDKAGNVSQITEKSFSTKASMTIGDYLISNPPTGLNTNMEGGLYRFQGTNVNNYICFGTTDKDTCIGNTDRYMYRIIGINSNKQAKLIKKEALNSVSPWSNNYKSNTSWPGSAVYNIINGSGFLNNSTYMPSGWSNKIATMSWKYGDTNTCHTSAASVYSAENGWGNTVSAKIGLMYMHDYYYGLSGGNNCCSNGNTCKTSWIYLSNNDSGAPGGAEWTMARLGYIGGYYLSWLVGTNGAVSGNGGNYNSNSYRPVFYLTSDVMIVSGTGTASDPFIIE